MGIALAVISTAVGVAGAIAQAQAAQAQAVYQAQVAAVNAQIAAQNRADAMKRGDIAIQDQRDKNAAGMATVAATNASRGLLIGVVGTTPDDVYWDAALAGEINLGNVRHNVALEMRRSEIQQEAFTAQSLNSMREAQAIGTAGAINALGVGVKGFGNIASMGGVGPAQGQGLLFS